MMKNNKIAFYVFLILALFNLLFTPTFGGYYFKWVFGRHNAIDITMLILLLIISLIVSIIIQGIYNFIKAKLLKTNRNETERLLKSEEDKTTEQETQTYLVNENKSQTTSKDEKPKKLKLGKILIIFSILLIISIILIIVLQRDHKLTQNNDNSTNQDIIHYSSKITDIDGNVYHTITIGKQEWTTENLNVEHYQNGDIIPQIQDKLKWELSTTGAWCYYENNSENGKTYGKLYNWYAVNDTRGLAPKGWHIPSDEEWTQLTDYLGGYGIAGGKMKQKELWNKPNYPDFGETINSSGFSALPSGSRNTKGFFEYLGEFCCFWSSSEKSNNTAWFRYLFHREPIIGRKSDANKTIGYSCRCIKD